MLILATSIKGKRPAWRLAPDFIVPSITDIDFNFLRRLGIKACLIDLDGTVVERERYYVDPKIAAVLKQSKLSIYIATNRPSSRDLKTLKEDLHATSVVHPTGVYGKPTKRYYRAALDNLGLQPDETVMIGDRYIQDVLGANRAGIYSLLVHKLGASKGKADEALSYIENTFTKMRLHNYHQVERVK